MVKGVGIDLAQISEIERLCEASGGAFLRATFTPREIGQSEGRFRPGEYLAGRFAVKEAVFKALAPAANGGLDPRAVESLDDDGGAPHVLVGEELAGALERADASQVLVSISNEGDFVTAVALVQ